VRNGRQEEGFRRKEKKKGIGDEDSDVTSKSSGERNFGAGGNPAPLYIARMCLGAQYATK
jgi:hypothetical protein